MEQTLVQQTGQVAWWIVGVIFFIVLAVCGFMLAMAYKGIIKRLDSLEEVLKGISKFLAKQEDKNKMYDEVKYRVDIIEDKVLIIEQQHRTCPVILKTVTI